MDDQLQERIKSERSEVIRKISVMNRISYMKSMLEKEQMVLIEKVDQSGMAHGYGEHYIPVLFPTQDPSKNRFQKVILTRVETSEPPAMIGG